MTVLGCARDERSAPPDTARANVQPAGTPVTASRSVAYTTVEEIKARVDSIDQYLEKHPDKLRVYAQVAGNDALVFVKDSTSWPEEVEASYNILHDAAGKPILHREMPTSHSGDWFATISHYLAPDGRTIYYEFQISGFTCDRILRETKRVYFDPAFAVLKEELSFADGDWKPITAVGDDCHRRSDNAPDAARNAAALKLK
jgi:hypothetical protein